MSHSASQIVAEIDAYMTSNGGANSEWYVGIAEDPRERLFSDHNVSEENGAWIYLQATSSEVAREVESAYINTGHDGGSGGGDSRTDYVYAYRKTTNTRE